MPVIDLSTLVALVGTLDDSPDHNSAAARFRTYLQEHVQSVSDVRAYTDAALLTKGDQYNKGLQDIINHIGRLLGFEVTFGRYRGVAGANGYDGLWQSPSGTSVVVETKTTDAYTIRTATLLGYINDLVSAGELAKSDEALGLYVYGRFDSGANQLEKSIIAEGRQEHLRVASVETLLHLLELKQAYETAHQTIVQLLLPSPVRVDTVVNLIFDVVSRAKRDVAEQSMESGSESAREPQKQDLPPNDWADSTKQTGLSDTKVLQLEFWDKFQEYGNNQKTKLKLRKPRPQHWYDISIGTGEAHISVTLNTKDDLIGCEIYIANSKQTYALLYKNKSKIEEELKEHLDWMELLDKKASRIKVTKNGNIEKKNEWQDYFEWLLKKAESFHRVFPKYING